MNKQHFGHDTYVTQCCVKWGSYRYIRCRNDTIDLDQYLLEVSFQVICSVKFVYIIAPHEKNYPTGTDVCFLSPVQSFSLYGSKVRVTYNKVSNVTFPGYMDFKF